MDLAIFDLDDTLIAGDSGYLWGEFLLKKNLVDVGWFKAENEKFFAQYNQGDLDINEWLEFQLKTLTQHPMEKLNQLNHEFIDCMIKPIVLKKAEQKIAQHRNHNDNILVISATNYFISKSVVELFNIDDIIATKPEIKNGEYTGKASGFITYQDGKIKALRSWLGNKKFNKILFYSDSHNDLPLLREVDTPIAVDPDVILQAEAVRNNWQTLSFR